VERWGFRPLTAACDGGHLDAVRALLAVGADVNKGTDDDSSDTALCSAVHRHRIDVVRELLAAGAELGAAAGIAVSHLPAWAQAVTPGGAPRSISSTRLDDVPAALGIHILLREAAAWRRRSAAVVTCAAGFAVDTDMRAGVASSGEARVVGSKQRRGRKDGRIGEDAAVPALAAAPASKRRVTGRR